MTGLSEACPLSLKEDLWLHDLGTMGHRDTSVPTLFLGPLLRALKGENGGRYGEDCLWQVGWGPEHVP